MRRAPSLWRWPLLIGLASAGGLVAALVGDGWADALSWLLLAPPVACALHAAWPARRSGRVAPAAAPPAHRRP